MSAQLVSHFRTGAAQFASAWAVVSLPTLAQPAQTVSAGEWTATGAPTLHAALGGPEGDAGYIGVNSASTAEVILAETAWPGGASQSLSYRASSIHNSTLTVTMKQGATTIMTRTHALTPTNTLYTQTLTPSEISLIVAGPISAALTTS